MGRLQTFVGLAGVVALCVSASLVTGINPLEYAGPALNAALDKMRGKLSEPVPRWSERVDGLPVAAVVTSSTVVVVLNGAVEARRLGDGGKAWTRVVDWATPAGEVVVAGRSKGGGFEVLDAANGAVRWQDPKAANAWAYEDMLLSVSCPGDREGCTLRARDTRTGAGRWRLRIPGAVQRLAGHPDLDEAVDRHGMLPPSYPGRAPRLVGALADRRVTVVDTRAGRAVGSLSEGANTRVAMLGDRVLGITARPRENGGCRYAARGWNPSGAEVWRHSGFDFGTVSGSGCEQRSDPVAAGGVIAAVRPDDRPVLVAVRSGGDRWTGRAGESLLATDGQVAIVRGANGRRLTAISALNGAELWNRTASRQATVAVTGNAVMINDSDAGEIVAVSPTSGAVLQRWKSQATILGVGFTGAVFGNGRTVGYARW